MKKGFVCMGLSFLCLQTFSREPASIEEVDKESTELIPSDTTNSATQNLPVTLKDSSSDKAQVNLDIFFAASYQTFSQEGQSWGKLRSSDLSAKNFGVASHFKLDSFVVGGHFDQKVFRGPVVPTLPDHKIDYSFSEFSVYGGYRFLNLGFSVPYQLILIPHDDNHTWSAIQPIYISLGTEFQKTYENYYFRLLIQALQAWDGYGRENVQITKTRGYGAYANLSLTKFFHKTPQMKIGILTGLEAELRKLKFSGAFQGSSADVTVSYQSYSLRTGLSAEF